MDLKSYYNEVVIKEDEDEEEEEESSSKKKKKKKKKVALTECQQVQADLGNEIFTFVKEKYPTLEPYEDSEMNDDNISKQIKKLKDEKKKAVADKKHDHALSIEYKIKKCEVEKWEEHCENEE